MNHWGLRRSRQGLAILSFEAELPLFLLIYCWIYTRDWSIFIYMNVYMCIYVISIICVNSSSYLCWLTVVQCGIWMCMKDIVQFFYRILVKYLYLIEGLINYFRCTNTRVSLWRRVGSCSCTRMCIITAHLCTQTIQQALLRRDLLAQEAPPETDALLGLEPSLWATSCTRNSKNSFAVIWVNSTRRRQTFAMKM